MKKIVLVSWFRIEDTYETIADAKRAAKRHQKCDRYKDVEIIELTESRKRII